MLDWVEDVGDGLTLTVTCDVCCGQMFMAWL